jgi:hypothetical protein
LADAHPFMGSASLSSPSFVESFMDAKKNIMCPSVPHTWPDARIFAVVGGTVEVPELSYLDEILPITDDLAALTAPVEPDEVFRMAGACAHDRCVHHDTDQDRCTLVV